MEFERFDESIKRNDKTVPVIDLSPFFLQDEYSSPVIRSRQSVIVQIGRACEEWGFFQAINHGVPVELIQQALATSNSFFDLPVEEKMKVRPEAGAFPTGYCASPPGTHERKEHFFLFAGDSDESTDLTHGGNACKYNVLPHHPPHFRSVIEKLVKSMGNASLLMESLVSESLGLPANYLRDHNKHKDKVVVLLRYPTAITPQEIGVFEHQDGSCMTFVGQDETGGYQVLKDGKWVDITPIKGALVVNIGDILQVWSNNRLKSAVHRTLNNMEKSRSSFAFSFTPGLESWVSPLPHFTTDIDSPAAYKTFLYKDYMRRRMRNKTHPPARAEDMVDISFYAV